VDVKIWRSDDPELATHGLERAQNAVIMNCLMAQATARFGDWDLHRPDRAGAEPNPFVPFSVFDTIFLEPTSGPPRPLIHFHSANRAVSEWAEKSFFRLEHHPTGSRLYPLGPIRDAAIILIRHRQVKLLAVETFEGANQELMAYFSRHPEALYDLHPRKFEELIAAIFRNLGCRTVLTPQSGDRGVDLRIFQHDVIGEIVTLVQAKRYAEHRPVELGVVQALSGAVHDERAHRGLVITTSRFLPGVKEWVEERDIRVELAERADIVRWCERAAEALAKI